MAEKQVVHYRKMPQNYIREGLCASVVAIDHPKFEPDTWVCTSRVRSYDKDTGVFKTKKTESTNRKSNSQAGWKQSVSELTA